jgi:hypothetical protein
MFKLVQSMMQSSQTIAAIFQNKFKVVQNMMQKNQFISSPYSKQVQTCKKHDAIKPIYCITGLG